MGRLLWRLAQGQRGYGTVLLALAGLTFTSLLVVPFLGYVQTSLLAVRSGEESSCGHAAVEYSLWRLQYDEPFVQTLTPESPSAAYEVPCDTYLVPVSVALQPQPSPIPEYLTEFAYADIVLVLDVSASISSSEMSVFKEGAHAIVDGFNLDENSERYRMGLAKFGQFSEPVTSMSDSAAPLHQGIDSLESTSLLTCIFNPGHIACRTNLVAGLDGGAAQYATGLGDRPDIPNLMVFLTDGNDNAGNSIADIENAATNTGARIFAVGIDEVFLDTLNAIASEPDEDHVFYAADFQALLALIDEIVAAVTQGGLAGDLYDIEIVAPDGSAIRVRALRTVEGEVVVISLGEV